MKNVALIVVWLLGGLGVVMGQKHDYTWVIGDAPMSMIFTDTSADTMRTERYIYMDNSQTTISDSAGNLLFFTNGAKIYNRNDSIMINGDSLNYGTWWNSLGGIEYDAMEEIIGLPTDTPAIWNFIHYYNENTPFQPPFLFGWRIYQTRVDMRGDTGLGIVVFKNKLIIQDTLGSYVTACKHANGRDWWVLASKSSSDCLYTLLVESDTIIEYPIQCLGSNYISQDAGQAAFSPDGTKFAWEGCAGGINIYDFDRCSGQLSNPINLPYYATYDSSNFQYGLAFSPNSEFLYVAQTEYVMQFDLQAADIASSADTVGYYKPPPDSTSLPGPFFLMQLGPDGKIYVSANNSIKWLHVINDPDVKGDSCNFVIYGFPLPYENSFGLPSYPGNYRLGPLQGSPCDTLSGLKEIQRAAKEQILKIYPNPAADYTIIDYGFTDWNKGQPDLEICNALGQMVYGQALPMYSGYQKIDVSSFAAGVYTVFIKRQGGVVASGRLVKE